MLANINHLKKRVEKLAEEKHFGQKDKAGVDYFNHVKYVAEMSENVAATIGMNQEFCDKCYMTGLLHDILMNTDATTNDLRDIDCYDDIIFAVEQLTQNEVESYDDYIKRSSNNPISRIVKYVDLMHDLDVTRFEKIEPDELEELNLNLKWFRFLQEKLV